MVAWYPLGIEGYLLKFHKQVSHYLSLQRLCFKFYLFFLLFFLNFFFSFASSFWIILEEGEDEACASFLNYDLHLVLNGSGFNDIPKNVYEWQTNLTSFCIGERSDLCIYICLQVKIKKEMSLNINIHPFVAHKKGYLGIIRVWMWDWRVRCILKMYMYPFFPSSCMGYSGISLHFGSVLIISYTMVYTHMVDVYCHLIYASIKVHIHLVLTSDIVSCIRNAPM
jgi:hypothetical protein